MTRINLGDSIGVVFIDSAKETCSKQMVVHHFGHGMLIIIINDEVLRGNKAKNLQAAENTFHWVMQQYPGSLLKTVKLGKFAQKEFLIENKITCFITVDVYSETWTCDFYDAEGEICETSKGSTLW